MKNESIRIKIEKNLKEDFKKACDGRTMTSVIELLIKAYVEKSKENKKTITERISDVF